MPGRRLWNRSEKLLTSNKKGTQSCLATNCMHCFVMERSISKELFFSINHRVRELGALVWSQWKRTLKAATSDTAVYHLTDSQKPSGHGHGQPGLAYSVREDWARWSQEIHSNLRHSVLISLNEEASLQFQSFHTTETIWHISLGICKLYCLLPLSWHHSKTKFILPISQAFCPAH